MCELRKLPLLGGADLGNYKIETTGVGFDIEK